MVKEVQEEKVQLKTKETSEPSDFKVNQVTSKSQRVFVRQ